MDKFTFEKYLKYRPKVYEHIVYWTMMIIYMASFSLTMILLYKYFPVFQERIYNKENDIVFSMYATGIFSLSFLFFSMIFYFVIIEFLFSHVPAAKNIILWYDVIGSKHIGPTTDNYDIYKKKNKINIVIMIFILIFSLFFSFVSIFVHLRINPSGIYYTKIFEFTEKYYGWNELKSVSIAGSGDKKDLSPEMVLEFGENKLDIWDGAGLGSPNSDVIIRIIELINENTEIIIEVDNNFTDAMLDSLYNKSTDRKRNNIINVFNYLEIHYLNEKQ